MKKILKSRLGRMFVILFVLGIGLLIFMVWGLHDANQKMGLKVNIPEIQNEDILKNIYFQNESIVAESVFVHYDDDIMNLVHYQIIKFKHSKILKEVIDSSTSYKKHFQIYTKGILGITLWDYPQKADSIDLKYTYNNPPISQYIFSDTVLVQNFSKSKIEISLTRENKRDLGFEIKEVATVILYQRKEFVYFILVYKYYDNKITWVTQEELKKTLYPLIKNWGVYEKR